MKRYATVDLITIVSFLEGVHLLAHLIQINSQTIRSGYEAADKKRKTDKSRFFFLYDNEVQYQIFIIQVSARWNIFSFIFEFILRIW